MPPEAEHGLPEDPELLALPHHEALQGPIALSHREAARTGIRQLMQRADHSRHVDLVGHRDSPAFLPQLAREEEQQHEGRQA